MKKLFLVVACLCAALVLAPLSAFPGDEDVVKSLMQGRETVKQVPNPSSLMPDLDLAKAYAVQKSLAKALIAKGDTLNGFKAGLTSQAGQKQFGVDQALLAPLFKSGALAEGAEVDPKKFVRLFIETEIGFVAGRKIDKPLPDVEALKKAISEVFPAVELPDIRFSDMKKLNGPDIAADAIGSAQYIVGKRIPADKVDVAAVEVKLNRDGETINQGKAADVMGDQWKALLWLINGAIAQGWVIEPGQVFLTGAMGRMNPGKPGKYEGDWGPLGKLSWTVK